MLVDKLNGPCTTRHVAFEADESIKIIRVLCFFIFETEL